MGNLCNQPKVTQVIVCIQQLQQVEVTLGHLIDKYAKQIREQQLEARAKMKWKADCMRHVRSIRVIRHHKNQMETRLTACMSKRYQLESLNVTKMHLKAIQNTSSTFEHFLKENQVERVIAIQDTLAEMIEDACEINEVISQEPLAIEEEDIEEDYNSMMAELATELATPLATLPLQFPTAPNGPLHRNESKNMELVPFR